MSSPGVLKIKLNNNVLKNLTVLDGIKRINAQYLSELERHPNYLAVNLTDNGDDTTELKWCNLTVVQFTLMF